MGADKSSMGILTPEIVKATWLAVDPENVWHEKEPDVKVSDQLGVLVKKCICGFESTDDSILSVHIKNSNPDPLSSDPATAWLAFGMMWEKLNINDREMFVAFEGEAVVSPVPLWTAVAKWKEIL